MWALWPAYVLIACTLVGGWSVGWIVGNWLLARDALREARSALTPPAGHSRP